MLKNLKLFLIDYSVVVLLTVFINLLIRIGEYWYISSVKFEELNLNLFFSKSVNFDTLFIVLFSLITLVPLALVSLYRLKLATVLSRIIYFLLILSLFILTEYFLINNALLSSAIFEFSVSEAVMIALSELSMNRIGFVLSLVALLLVALLLFLTSRKIINPRIANYMAVVYLLLGIVSLVNRKHTFKSLSYFTSYNHFLVGNSKPIFLLKTYEDNLALDVFSTQQEIKEAIIKYQSLFTTKQFNSLVYPLSNTTEYENSLGEYFKTSTKKPNIVLIISESLSSSFSGNNLSLKNSLTPFTDSLANLGLSWNNFFSNAERSYGVLPNLLASLPTGTGARGFINMDKGPTDNLRFPKHTSLIQILNDNGYQTSYFYGGAGNFDNVADYMNQNEVSNCFTLEKFDTTKYVMNLYARSKQAWGYKDADLYSQGLDVMDTIQFPYLSIFQTLSNHSPYNLSDEEYYSKTYLNEKLESLGLSNEDVKKIDNNILSSIFYADDALRSFFNRIKGRADFENTIFIITGDHAVDLNLADHVFENYHTPFIIYSPLLTKTAQFNAVNSHLDVLPSLLSLLKNNFNLSIPNANNWLGEGLLTSVGFKSNQFIPLNVKAADMPSIIIKDKLLFAGDVYRFNERLETIKVTDLKEIATFMEQVNTYKNINEHVCKNNLISN